MQIHYQSPPGIPPRCLGRLSGQKSLEMLQATAELAYCLLHGWLQSPTANAFLSVIRVWFGVRGDGSPSVPSECYFWKLAAFLPWTHPLSLLSSPPPHPRAHAPLGKSRRSRRVRSLSPTEPARGCLAARRLPGSPRTLRRLHRSLLGAGLWAACSFSVLYSAN